ncbi:MAG: hypothetical protein V4687_07955 [Bacteroidota bacterium]
MKRHYAVPMFCLALTMLFKPAHSQTKAILFEGIIVTGYVDNGGYLNCTGPSIKMIKKPYTLFLGLLPSLKIKEDKVIAGAPKNSILTPFLGFGFTAAFHHLAVQLPAYYTNKTAAKDGRWKMGVGLGYKF